MDLSASSAPDKTVTIAPDSALPSKAAENFRAEIHTFSPSPPLVSSSSANLPLLSITETDKSGNSSAISHSLEESHQSGHTATSIDSDAWASFSIDKVNAGDRWDLHSFEMVKRTMPSDRLILLPHHRWADNRVEWDTIDAATGKEISRVIISPQTHGPTAVPEYNQKDQ